MSGRRVLLAVVACLALVRPLLAGAAEAARWIGEDPAPPSDPEAKSVLGQVVKNKVLPKNTVRFRRRFELPSGRIAKAEARVCGLGFYELWVNGEAVDPMRRLAPNWTNPHDRVMCDAYNHGGDCPRKSSSISPCLSDAFAGRARSPRRDSRRRACETRSSGALLRRLLKCA